MFTTEKKRKTIYIICKKWVCLRLQEKLLANLDEDHQNDAGLSGGDEVSQTLQALCFCVFFVMLFPLTKLYKPYKVLWELGTAACAPKVPTVSLNGYG